MLFNVLFEQTTSHMRMNARSRHASHKKPTRLVLFHLIMPLLLLLTTNYKRITIQLDSITKWFITCLSNKCAIVCKGTVYHSNWSSQLAWWLQYRCIDCRNALRNIFVHYQSIAAWVLPLNCHMVALAIKGLNKGA